MTDVSEQSVAAGCDCLTEINAKLAEHNAEVVITWYPVTRPVIETMKVDSKKRGKPPLVVATFCPFCGAKYPDSAALLAAPRAGEGVDRG